jgi:metal-responsive CopG/Arc/MetJ family transcriptional regulator
METLSIKIQADLVHQLDEASARAHVSRSELVRRAISAYVAREGSSRGSALEAAGELVGCFSGGPKDLASNPSHLKDFGRR